MKRSTERILTTHTGSLPRPEGITELLYDRAAGQVSASGEYHQRISDGVRVTVDAQAQAGVDVVNDGETGKLSYFSYVTERLTGFGGEAAPSPHRLKDMSDFPSFRSSIASSPKDGDAPKRKIDRPMCIDKVSYIDTVAVSKDIDDLKRAAASNDITELFLSAASPGLISAFMQNDYYKDREEYLFALADTMRVEYEAITDAGILLQLDCPDLAGSFNSTEYENVDMFRNDIAMNIEAINHATRNIPEDRMRMHVCWGNYEGPHNHDIPLKDIVDIIMKARPAAVSFEGANPRHAHEYNVWDDMELPDGKVLMPGVLDSTTNYVEHPELIAQRIVSYAKRVGRENVIPGSDCGFGTGAGMGVVNSEIVWAKLAALSEGAHLATQQLW